MNTSELPLFLRDCDYTIEDGHVVINGDLKIHKYYGYSEIYLIDDLHIKGRVYIDEVESVTIGERVHIDGSLTIFECNELRIPSWPSIGSYVDLHLCDIYDFPQDEITSNDRLLITSSTFFSCALPSKITTYGDIRLHECHGKNLKKIDVLKCFGNASISFNNVDIIPDDVFVAKSLKLDSNDNFLLPHNIVVLGNLYIRESNTTCGFKNNLNEDALIGGFIDIHESAKLTIESFINVCVIHSNNLVLGYNNSSVKYKDDVDNENGIILTRPVYGDNEKPGKVWYINHNKQSYRSLVNDKGRKKIVKKLHNNIGDAILNIDYVCDEIIYVEQVLDL